MRFNRPQPSCNMQDYIPLRLKLHLTVLPLGKATSTWWHRTWRHWDSSTLPLIPNWNGLKGEDDYAGISKIYWNSGVLMEYSTRNIELKGIQFSQVTVFWVFCYRFKTKKLGTGHPWPFCLPSPRVFCLRGISSSYNMIYNPAWQRGLWNNLSPAVLCRRHEPTRE